MILNRKNVLIGPMLAVALFALFAALPGTITTANANGGPLSWTGQGTSSGMPTTIQCSGDTPNPGTLLWVFTGGPDVTSATLTVNGTPYSDNSPSGGSFHFVTPWYTLDPAVTNASVTWTGDANSNPQLVISHGCPPNPDIKTTKAASQGEVCGNKGILVTYTFVVSNPGGVTLTNVQVTDDVLGSLTAKFVAANGGSSSLAPGASVQFTATRADSVTTTNIVTARGDALGQSPADTDTATATVTARNCSIDITKSASPTQVCTGKNAQVTYSYVVKNDGEVALSNVSVNDDKLGSIGTVASLAPGSSVPFTKAGTVNTTTTNIASAQASALGASVTDTATATVSTLTCSVSISKSASVLQICADKPTSVTYKYKVTNTGQATLTNLTIVDDKLGNIATVTTLAPGVSTQEFTKSTTLTVTTVNVATVTGSALTSTITNTATATVNAVTCSEWCSPGFWLNNAVNFGASAWKVPTNTLYSSVISSPAPIAGTNPTLLQVLQNKQAYFTSQNQGEAFNKVGDYLSLQAGLKFNGTRTDNCPLDQQGRRLY